MGTRVAFSNLLGKLVMGKFFKLFLRKKSGKCFPRLYICGDKKIREGIRCSKTTRTWFLFRRTRDRDRKAKPKEVFKGIFSMHLWDGFYDGQEYEGLGIVWSKTNYNLNYKKTVQEAVKEYCEKSTWKTLREDCEKLTRNTDKLMMPSKGWKTRSGSQPRKRLEGWEPVWRKVKLPIHVRNTDFLSKLSSSGNIYG